MKRASLTAIGLFALVVVGCATGGQDDGAPRADAAVDSSLADASADTTLDSSTADSSADDSSSAETSTPDGTAPDSVSDTMVPDTTAPDTTAPDTTAPDTTAPDTTAPDTTAPDTAVPDTTVVDTAVPDTTVPETAGPDTAETAVPCPTPITLGSFDASADGWTFDGLWRYDGGSASMVAGSTTKYSSSYTQNLTNPANVDLSSCASATLSFSVRLADDPDYASKGPDKSERLYVQCSGDGGGTWTNLVPSPWPTNQSACATSYCCGGPGSTRSFPLTAQSIVLPAACRTAAARFRFQAKGSSVWNLQNPGWYVDNVKVN